MDTTLGVVVMIGWIALVLWGAGKIMLSVRRGGEWKSTHAMGLVASAALAAGIVLSLKKLLPDDTFGVGMILTIGGGVALWALTYSDEA
jgi:hypothetical protein